MTTIQQEIHNISLQLELDIVMLNGYRSKVFELHKQIKHHAYLILNSTPYDLAYHSAKIAEYSTLLEEYNAEIEMLEQSIQMAHDDIDDLESEV